MKKQPNFTKIFREYFGTTATKVRYSVRKDCNRIHDFVFLSSLVHDAMYQLMRMGEMSNIYREEADKLLRDICIEDGMWRVRAWWVYRAVRMFGGRAARADIDTPDDPA